MKSQLGKKQIEQLKESHHNLEHIKKSNFQSRHKLEQSHLYWKEDVETQIPVLKSRRKKKDE